MNESNIRKKYTGKLSLIKKGGFSSVILEESKNEKRAIKIIQTFDKDQNSENLNELMNLTRLKGNKHIMSFEKYYQDIQIDKTKKLYQLEIIMDYAEKTLDDLISEPPKKIKENKLVKILIQIADGLKFAHKQKCVHLDLKPQNILFVGSRCKIADWGGSFILIDENKKKKKENGCLSISYTYGYEAPEIIKYIENEAEEINFYECDIYSFGILILRCCGIRMSRIKKIPKNSKSDHDKRIKELIKKVKAKEYSEELCEIIRKICKFNGERRILIEEIENKLIDLYK